MAQLFSYGTLQQEAVQLSTFGRLLQGEPDELVGFEQRLVEIEDPRFVAASGKAHHAIVKFNGREDSRVGGIAFEVSDEELANADAYEPAGYERVLARLASGKRAWVYAEGSSVDRGSRARRAGMEGEPMTVDRKIPRHGSELEFRFDEGLPVLRRTPGVLRALLMGLPAVWTGSTEGPGTWSPFDVVGHLIHGERTNWVPRVEHMLRHGDAVPFPVFDRETMFAASTGLSMNELLDTFERLRTDSLVRLGALELTDADLARRGLHPEFGVVTLRQHLSTWVAHDLGHVSQVVRVMARQYSNAVGPWHAYLSILR